MKKSADEKTVLSLLDVIGSCLVDIFYNHMYDRAIAVHEKTSRGLTECYREAIANYLGESKNPRFYCVLLNSIHHYVRMSTIYTDISYTECISMYAALFVPQMYANSLTTDQRVNLVSMILSNTVRALAKEVNQQHIGCIIDDHTDPTNIEILQDVVLKLLIQQRELSYDRFIQAQKKATTAAQQKDTRPEENVMVKLSAALKKFVAERSVLKDKNTALVAKNIALANQFNELKAMFLRQINVQKEQAKLIEELKKRLVTTETAPVNATTWSTTSNNSENDNSDNENHKEQSDDENAVPFDDELFSVEYVEEPVRY